MSHPAGGGRGVPDGNGGEEGGGLARVGVDGGRSRGREGPSNHGHGLLEEEPRRVHGGEEARVDVHGEEALVGGQMVEDFEEEDFMEDEEDEAERRTMSVAAMLAPLTYLAERARAAEVERRAEEEAEHAVANAVPRGEIAPGVGPGGGEAVPHNANAAATVGGPGAVHDDATLAGEGEGVPMGIPAMGGVGQLNMAEGVLVLPDAPARFEAPVVAQDEERGAAAARPAPGDHHRTPIPARIDVSAEDSTANAPADSAAAGRRLFPGSSDRSPASAAAEVGGDIGAELDGRFASLNIADDPEVLRELLFLAEEKAGQWEEISWEQTQRAEAAEEKANETQRALATACRSLVEVGESMDEDARQAEKMEEELNKRAEAVAAHAVARTRLELTELADEKERAQIRRALAAEGEVRALIERAEMAEGKVRALIERAEVAEGKARALIERAEAAERRGDELTEQLERDYEAAEEETRTRYERQFEVERDAADELRGELREVRSLLEATTEEGRREANAAEARERALIERAQETLARQLATQERQATMLRDLRQKEGDRALALECQMEELKRQLQEKEDRAAALMSQLAEKEEELAALQRDHVKSASEIAKLRERSDQQENAPTGSESRGRSEDRMEEDDVGADGSASNDVAMASVESAHQQSSGHSPTELRRTRARSQPPAEARAGAAPAAARAGAPASRGRGRDRLRDEGDTAAQNRRQRGQSAPVGVVNRLSRPTMETIDAIAAEVEARDGDASAWVTSLRESSLFVRMNGLRTANAELDAAGRTARASREVRHGVSGTVHSRPDDEAALEDATILDVEWTENADNRVETSSRRKTRLHSINRIYTQNWRSSLEGSNGKWLTPSYDSAENDAPLVKFVVNVLEIDRSALFERKEYASGPRYRFIGKQAMCELIATTAERRLPDRYARRPRPTPLTGDPPRSSPAPHFDWNTPGAWTTLLLLRDAHGDQPAIVASLMRQAGFDITFRQVRGAFTNVRDIALERVSENWTKDEDLILLEAVRAQLGGHREAGRRSQEFNWQRMRDMLRRPADQIKIRFRTLRTLTGEAATKAKNDFLSSPERVIALFKANARHFRVDDSDGLACVVHDYASVDREGYGGTRLDVGDGRLVWIRWHVMACALNGRWNGILVEGKHAAHKCMKPGCVFPFHLDYVLAKTNEAHKGHYGYYFNGSQWIKLPDTCDCPTRGEPLCLRYFVIPGRTKPTAGQAVKSSRGLEDVSQWTPEMACQPCAVDIVDRDPLEEEEEEEEEED